MYRTLCAFAIALALAVPASAVCGDANADGSTNILDSLSVAYELAGVPPGITSSFDDADVNGSGVLEIMDALLIAQYSANVIAQLACGGAPPPPPPGPEQIFLGSSFPNQVVVVDGTTLSVTATIPLADTPVSLAADPVRDRVYVSYPAGSVQIIDPATNTLNGSLYVAGLTGTMKVSPDGATLVGDASGNVVVYDLNTNSVRATVVTGSWGWGNHIAITNDSRWGYVTQNDLNEVIKIDLLAGTLTDRITVGSGPWGISIDDASSTAYVINHNEQTMSRIDLATGTEIMPRNAVGNYPMDIEAGTNGFVYSVNCLNNAVGEHDGQNGQQQGSIPVGNEPTEIEECPHGHLVVMNSISGNASIIDPSGQNSPVTIPLGGSPSEPAVK